MDAWASMRRGFGFVGTSFGTATAGISLFNFVVLQFNIRVSPITEPLVLLFDLLIARPLE
jgi:hypothetical protein